MNPSVPNPSMPRQSGGGMGFIIATVLLLALILIGGVYFWRARSANDAALKSVEQQSSSDATLDIEADLNATDVDNVDYDLNESNFTGS